MIRELQTSTTLPYYEQRVDLDGTVFIVRYRWNSRRSYWSVDIFDADENPIVLARKLEIDTDLVRQSHHLACPEGVLTAFDTTVAKVPPGINELGDRVILLYVEAADIAAL